MDFLMWCTRYARFWCRSFVAVGTQQAALVFGHTKRTPLTYTSSVTKDQRALARPKAKRAQRPKPRPQDQLIHIIKTLCVDSQ